MTRREYLSMNNMSIKHMQNKMCSQISGGGDRGGNFYSQLEQRGRHHSQLTITRSPTASKTRQAVAGIN